MRTPAAWLRRVRRRECGVYAYRTRRHGSPWRTEWGYVGESQHLPMRHECHGGTCGRHANCVEKPWWDLVVRRHIVIRLPWWLGWKWILLPLETLVIVLLRPRYNGAKNKRRTRTPPVVQQIQRNARDAAAATGSPVYRARLSTIKALTVTRAAAALMIVTGLGGWWLTR